MWQRWRDWTYLASSLLWPAHATACARVDWILVKSWARAIGSLFEPLGVAVVRHSATGVVNAGSCAPSRDA